jgi:hypothetical protein
METLLPDWVKKIQAKKMNPAGKTAGLEGTGHCPHHKYF